MDFLTNCDNINNIRYHKLVGKISKPILQSTFNSIKNSSTEYQKMDAIWDAREADFTSISSKDIGDFAKLVSNDWGRFSNNKIALVVKDALNFGLTRIYGAEVDSQSSITFQIFRDIDEAKTWIKTKELRQ